MAGSVMNRQVLWFQAVYAFDTGDMLRINKTGFHGISSITLLATAIFATGLSELMSSASVDRTTSLKSFMPLIGVITILSP